MNPPSWAVRFRGGELALRIGSALVLIPMAVLTAYFGGRLFALFWGAAGMGVLWEWMSLVAGSRRRPLLLTGAAALALPLILVLLRLDLAAVIVLALGALAAMGVAARGRQLWAAAGIPYAGCLVLAPAVLRSDSKFGFLAIIFLFTIVWTTDIAAYFTGRAVGGPKLLPEVSPNKTWSGAIGGLLAAMLAAIAFARITETQWFAMAMLAGVLSVFAQAGDVFESFLKRRFDAKDSSRLIPGHGGLMDRLDGFITASAVAALLGLARGSLEAPARGLLLW